jgi:hypothetical protein
VTIILIDSVYMFETITKDGRPTYYTSCIGYKKVDRPTVYTQQPISESRQIYSFSHYATWSTILSVDTFKDRTRRRRRTIVDSVRWVPNQ